MRVIYLILEYLVSFTAFAIRKNTKQGLLFFLIAARAAGTSPLGSKGDKPPHNTNLQ
jgi:hypothetical protein